MGRPIDADRLKMHYAWWKDENKEIFDSIIDQQPTLDTPEISFYEKRLPKKPLHTHKNYYCPVCKEDGWIMWDDAVPSEFDNYCSRCGQALDWSDVKCDLH